MENKKIETTCENQNEEIRSLSEEQLQDVAGGVGEWKKCYFTPAGGQEQRVDSFGRTTYHMKCASRCGIGWTSCSCLATARCVDKWHIMTEHYELLPQDISNHSSKPRANNYNT